MEVYSSNSFKSKELEKTNDIPKIAEKVASGKKKERNKFLASFIAEDAKDVKEYLVTDVIIPAIKKAIIDVVTEGINRLLGTNYKASSSTASKYSYKAYYDEKAKGRPVSQPSNRYTYDMVEYETRGEAEQVLTAMGEIIDKYEFVRVGDMLDLSDLTPSPQDYKYGWNDIRMATVERERGVYVIKLPKAMPLD